MYGPSPMKRGETSSLAGVAIGVQVEQCRAVVAALAMALVGVLPGEAAAQAPVPELTPAGWTMRISTNSIYFTRPDIPNVQVAFVNDIRAGLAPAEKFESAKEFFAQSAGCPNLATAETQESFGGLSAFDDAEAPRCSLIGLGHWREGGLQIALVLNEMPSAGPRPGDDVFDGIMTDMVRYAMYRYQVGDTGEEVSLPVEAYAGEVSPSDGPSHILNFVDEAEAFEEAMTALEILNHESGTPFPRRDGALRPVLLFAASGSPARQLGSLCTDWDPGMFSPAAMMTYHARNNCQRFEWRWKDGVENSEVEVKPIAGDWLPLTDHMKAERTGVRAAEPYRKLYRGRTYDLQISYDPINMGRVVRGESPITELGPNDAILTSDGRITLGHLESATLPELDPDVGFYRPVTGAYFFAGHVVTIKLDDGRVVHGFGGWLPGDGEEEFGKGSTLMINGVHYMAR